MKFLLLNLTFAYFLLNLIFQEWQQSEYDLKFVRGICMRKLFSLTAVIFLLCVYTFSDGKFMVSVSGNYLVPSDSGYKDIYGDSVFYPELKAGCTVYKGVYVFAGYGFFTRKGTTLEFGQKAESTQNFLSFGIGYEGSISDRFGYKLELGLLHAKYKEEAMGEEVSGSSTGFGGEAGFLYRIHSFLFAKVFAGYLRASDRIQDVAIELGGFKAGLGLEFRF